MEDESLDRFKDRLVGKGFTQVSGVDFVETFSLVRKTTTIKLVISLVVSFKWAMKECIPTSW